MPNYTKISAFEYFGVKAPNPRWGWSGISDDEKVVAVIIWKDHTHVIKNKGDLFYDGFDEIHNDTIHLWGDQQGNNARKNHLIASLENSDGLVRVCIATAIDVTVHPREIERIHPMKNMWFKISKFDENSGQFSLTFSHKDDENH